MIEDLQDNDKYYDALTQLENEGPTVIPMLLARWPTANEEHRLSILDVFIGMREDARAALPMLETVKDNVSAELKLSIAAFFLDLGTAEEWSLKTLEDIIPDLDDVSDVTDAIEMLAEHLPITLPALLRIAEDRKIDQLKRMEVYYAFGPLSSLPKEEKERAEDHLREYYGEKKLTLVKWRENLGLRIRGLA